MSLKESEKYPDFPISQGQEPYTNLFKDFLSGEIDAEECQKRCQELFQNPETSKLKFIEIQIGVAIIKYTNGDINFEDFNQSCLNIYQNEEELSRHSIHRRTRDHIIYQYLKGKINLQKQNQLLKPILPDYPLLEHFKNLRYTVD